MRAAARAFLLPPPEFGPTRRGSHFLRRTRLLWFAGAAAVCGVYAVAPDDGETGPVAAVTRGPAYLSRLLWRGTTAAVSSTASAAVALVDASPAGPYVARWWDQAAPVLASHWSFWLSEWWAAPLSELDEWVFLHPSDVDAAVIHALRLHRRPAAAVAAFFNAKFPPPTTYYVPDRLALVPQCDPTVPTADAYLSADGLPPPTPDAPPPGSVALAEAAAFARANAGGGDWRLWAGETAAPTWRRWYAAVRLLISPRVGPPAPDNPVLLALSPPAAAWAVGRAAAGDVAVADAFARAPLLGAAAVEAAAEAVERRAALAGVPAPLAARFAPEVPGGGKPLLVLPLFGSVLAPVGTAGYDYHVLRPGALVALRRLAARYELAFVANHAHDFVQNAVWALWPLIHPDEPRRTTQEGGRVYPRPIMVGIEQMPTDTESGHAVLDLTRFAPRWPLSKIVVVDHRVYAAKGQEDNWVVVPKWDGESNGDPLLSATLPLLELLADPSAGDDVRDTIRSATRAAVSKGCPVGVAFLDDAVRASAALPAAVTAAPTAWERMGAADRWDAVRVASRRAVAWARAGGLVPAPLLPNTPGADAADDLRRERAPWVVGTPPPPLPDTPELSAMASLTPALELGVRRYVDPRHVRVPEGDGPATGPYAREEAEARRRLVARATAWWRVMAAAYPPTLFPHLAALRV